MTTLIPLPKVFSPISTDLHIRTDACIRSSDFEKRRGTRRLTAVADIEETILVLVLLIDRAHQRRRRGQDLVHKDEDGLFRGQLDTFTDDVDELTDRQILPSPHQGGSCQPQGSLGGGERSELTAGTRYFFLSISEISDFSTFSQMTCGVGEFRRVQVEWGKSRRRGREELDRPRARRQTFPDERFENMKDNRARSAPYRDHENNRNTVGKLDETHGNTIVVLVPDPLCFLLPLVCST